MALNLFKRKSTLTICLILRSGSRLLEGWEALKGIADEFIVMNCSADESALAKLSSHSDVKIIQSTIMNDMESLRNKAQEESSSEWVFMFNSDEILPEESLENIKTLIAEKNTDAYTFDVRNYVHSKGGTIYSNYVPNKGDPSEKGDGYFNAVSLRLFRNYEELPQDLYEGKAQISHSGIFLHNYNSLKTLAGSGDDMGLVVAEEKMEKNKTSLNCFNVGSAYLERGDYKRAVELFHEANKLDPMNVEIHNSLGVAYFKAGTYDKALKSLTTALKVPPNEAKMFTNRYPFATLFASIGAVLTKQERYTKAIIAYEKALKMGHPQMDVLKQKVEDLKKIKEEKTKLNYQFTLNQ